MNESLTMLANKESAKAGREVYLSVINEETKKPREMQEQLIMELLKENADTEYGKKYGFADMHTVDDYRKKVPVQVYDDFAPYIERIMNGEKNILTAYTIDQVNFTSGTVGAKKFIPMTDRQTRVFMKYNHLYLNGLKAELLPEEWMSGKAFCPNEGTCTVNESGITIGCASAKNAAVLKDNSSMQAQMMRAIFTSPVEAIVPEKGTDTKYLHMRFALAERNLTGIFTGFYNVLVHYFQYLANNYEMLINDIEKGTIDESIEMPESVRESVLRQIQPNPERAKELRTAFADGVDVPFLKKVWPNLCYLSGAGGDGMAVYDRKIKEKYSGDLVHNIYSGITSSEGLWSVPSGVDTLDNILAAGSAFMEFLPVDAGDDFSEAVLIDELEEGKIYELIITNLSGLYRYRMSDAIKVTGFINKTPLVQFMYRVNKTINIAAEKTTEMMLDKIVHDTAEELGFFLSDYCVYPNYDEEPGRYDFLIETGDDGPRVSIEELQACVSRNLKKTNPIYAYVEEHGQLGEPEVKLLQPETGLLYRDMMAFKGANLSQLKPVHVISNEQQRKFFFGLIEE